MKAKKVIHNRYEQETLNWLQARANEKHHSVAAIVEELIEKSRAQAEKPDTPPISTSLVSTPAAEALAQEQPNPTVQWAASKSGESRKIIKAWILERIHNEGLKERERIKTEERNKRVREEARIKAQVWIEVNEKRKEENAFKSRARGRIDMKENEGLPDGALFYS